MISNAVRKYMPINMADSLKASETILEAITAASEISSEISGIVEGASNTLSDAALKGKNLLADMFMLAGYIPKEDVKVYGSVSPGFEPVRALFQENFEKGFDKSAQLCVYVGDEKVIDIWASTDRHFGEYI